MHSLFIIQGFPKPATSEQESDKKELMQTIYENGR
jgi:hypothetical protein